MLAMDFHVCVYAANGFSVILFFTSSSPSLHYFRFVFAFVSFTEHRSPQFFVVVIVNFVSVVVDAVRFFLSLSLSLSSSFPRFYHHHSFVVSLNNIIMWIYPIYSGEINTLDVLCVLCVCVCLCMFGLKLVCVKFMLTVAHIARLVFFHITIAAPATTAAAA